jgi:hypothetical protein
LLKNCCHPAALAEREFGRCRSPIEGYPPVSWLLQKIEQTQQSTLPGSAGAGDGNYFALVDR